MNNTNINEEHEALKRENLFLKLRLRTLKKSYKALREKFDSLQKHFFKGITVFSSTDERLKNEYHISTTKYAKERGFKAKTVFSILRAEGIITKVGKLIYLAKPQEYGRYAIMVSHDYGCLKRNLLYWNEEGVKFLDKLFEGYGMTPKSTTK